MKIINWNPIKTIGVKGVIFIIHGMGENSSRYEVTGKYLSLQGYKVAMIDHKGHGKNIKKIEELALIEDDFKSSIEELKDAIEKVKSENSELPFYLLGHSMGSFLTQIILEDGLVCDGVILSGSNRPSKIAIKLAYSLSKFLSRFKNKRNKFLDKLVFGLYNIKFKGHQKSRWLSRDEKIVEEFDNDPLCGAIPYTTFFRGLFHIIGKTIEVGEKKKNIEIPLYIFSGEDDPVGEYGKGTTRLYEFYKGLGYRRLTLKLYKGGRHEMFNEINKEEVFDDLIEWLNREEK